MGFSLRTVSATEIRNIRFTWPRRNEVIATEVECKYNWLRKKKQQRSESQGPGVTNIVDRELRKTNSLY